MYVDFFLIGNISRKFKELLNIHLGYEFAQILVFEITSNRNRPVIVSVEKVRGSVAIVGEGTVGNGAEKELTVTEKYKEESVKRKTSMTHDPVSNGS